MGTIEFGVVRAFDKAQGFGYITSDDGGPDILVRVSEIDSDRSRELEQGRRASHRVGGTVDRPRAESVHVL
jgi:cold shock protein